MASNNINVKLSLKDQFTKPLKVAAKGTKEFEAQLKYAKSSTSSFATSLSSNVISSLTKVTAAATAAATAIAGIAIKQGFSEAMNLEGYRLQLETATKDTQKAAEIMKYAINLANRTPFEGGELVQASTMMQAVGLEAEDYLEIVGNMAAAMNKDIDTATNAFIKAATTGEMEMMKQFGITKDRINQYAKETMGKEVVSASGQIKNQAEYQKALVAYMTYNFEGGMEKQATTMKGMWSTVTGVVKNSLATIVGVTDEGTVREGSAFDLLKQKVQVLAETLTKWQQDGTIQKIAEQFTNYLGKAIDTITTAITWLKDNSTWIIPMIKYVGGAIIVFASVVKVITMIKSAIAAVNMVIGITNVLMAANPIGAVIVAVGLLVAGIVLLWKNCEGFRNLVMGIIDGIKTKLEEAKEGFFNFVEGVKAKFQPLLDLFEAAKEKVSALGDNPIVAGMINGAKGIASGISSLFGGHALGTSYFSGGATGINEHGGEAAILPSGTAIIPADKTNKMLSGGQNISVNINVNGNIIGNDDYADYLGKVLVSKLREVAVNS